MKADNRFYWILTVIVVLAWCGSTVDAQRFRPVFLVSNGPDGPIHGGESAVTDMVLMEDGWVYGSARKLALPMSDWTAAVRVVCAKSGTSSNK